MQGIREYFRSTNYLFLDDSQVRMIDGWEEGAFSFLAANYLKKEFTLVRDQIYINKIYFVKYHINFLIIRIRLIMMYLELLMLVELRLKLPSYQKVYD